MPECEVVTAPTAVSRALMDRIARQITQARAEWQDSSDGETAVPVQRYFDEAIWQGELQALFRPLPLIAAHASELAPGQLLAHDGFGQPMLLTRDADGWVRAFLNVCRHRGMRLEPAAARARSATAVVCPYHGWSYRLNGTLRHRLHGEAFDPRDAGDEALVPLPCEERHGLIWVVPDPQGRLDLDAFLAGLGPELDYLRVAPLRHFRTVEAEYPANWKLIVDAFLEPYHIRVLHKDTIYPFFADGITSAERFGDHIHSLVARRPAEAWAQGGGDTALAPDALRQLVTPSQVIFPNTVTIFHPDYLSLITLYPVGPERLRWTHRMLIPADKATADWTPHWEKTFRLIEQGVFQKEDIHCAVGIQQGLRTGANQQLRVGRVEQALGWYHASVARHLSGR